jgi:hypothetical protein
MMMMMMMTVKKKRIRALDGQGLDLWFGSVAG